MLTSLTIVAGLPSSTAGGPCSEPMTKEEAAEFLRLAVKEKYPSWVSLPRFSIEADDLPEEEAAGNYVFDLLWDNPVGSVNITHLGMSAISGEVWDPSLCESFSSPGIRALQAKRRKQACVSAKEARALRRKRTCWN